MAKGKPVLTVRPAKKASQSALEHIQATLEDIDLLVPGEEDASR
jgi:hypothetical protein